VAALGTRALDLLFGVMKLIIASMCWGKHMFQGQLLVCAALDSRELMECAHALVGRL
jgi:hypothetical protein